MKICPRCERVYDDETLNFCLDDGEWLKEDDSAEGGETKVFPPDGRSEAATRQKISQTGETEVLPTEAIRRHSDGKRRPDRIVIGAAAGLLIALAAGYGAYRYFSGESDPTDSVPNVATERLTGEGNTREAAISPDGKFLAFLEVSGNEKTLRVKQIETGSTVEVLKGGQFENIGSLVFSADGNFVYFAAIDSTKKAMVYKVPALGGTPVPTSIESMVFSVAPDGSRIAYHYEDAETTVTALFIANADGTGARKAVERKGRTFIAAGSEWSPDGKKLLIVEGDDDRLPNSPLSLAIHDLEKGTTEGLGSDRWETINDGLAWDSSGRFIYVTGSRAGGDAVQVWRVSVPEGEAVKLTRNEKNYSGLSITSDGSRLVTTELEFRSGIWVSPDLDPMNAVEVFPARGDTWSLDWTPDGRIVYVSDQSGATEVWVMNADGSGQKQLTNDRITKSSPKVSPDGGMVAYHSPIDGFQIYTVPISGGNPSRISTGVVGPDNPDFSKDGKYIAFSAWAEGKQSLFRIPLTGGKAERLTDYPSTEPDYSPDGSLIACYYVAADDRFFNLGILPAEGGAPVKKFALPANALLSRRPEWMPDGKQITFLAYEGDKVDLWAQSVSGGEPVRLSDFSRPWIQRRAYSRDGTRIAIARGEGLNNAVMLKLKK